jgi:hypothetical protein
MITKMAKADIIELGVRNRAGYLLEQCGYTMGLAKLDGSALADLLPAGYLDEVVQVADEVRVAYKKKELAMEESKSSTEHVNELVRQAKIWRRAIVCRALRAKRLGEEIPDGLLKTENPSGVAGISVQIEKMLKLAEANAGSLPGTDVKALIKEGETLAKNIAALDSEQAVNLLKNKPDAVKDFCYEKGLLYIGIKVINDAGRELHAGDPTAAAKYNLSILYRQTGKKKAAASPK